MRQDLVDFLEVVVARQRHQRNLGSLKLACGELSPFAHALEHQPLEQRRLLLRVGFQALIFRFRHDRRVEADIALALDELVELVLAVDLDLLAMLKREEAAVGLLGDGDHRLAGQVAPEYEDIGAVELGAVDEFLEADVGAMEVGGEEHLHLPVCVLALLAPEHDGTLGSELGQILVNFPLRD